QDRDSAKLPDGRPASGERRRRARSGGVPAALARRARPRPRGPSRRASIAWHDGRGDFDSAVTSSDLRVRQLARILIVDDHPIFRAGARMLLERDPQLVVVGEAATAEEALARTAHEQPDLVLLDLDLGGVDGLDILEQLQAAAPKTRIVILTGVRGAELPV